MTFPIEQSAANTTQTSNNTEWGLQNMPAGIVAGDTLLAFVAVDGSNQSVQFNPTGLWVKLLDGAAGSDGSVTLAIAYKKAEGGDTLSLTIGSAQQGSCRIIRVDTAEDPDTQAPEIGAVTTGSSATPAVGLITPTGGAKDYKYYAVCAHDRNRTFTSAPTNHQANDGTLSSGGANGAQVSWGDHDANAATDDPDNFTYTASDGFATVVLVVHPAAATGEFFQNVDGSLSFAGGLVRETRISPDGTLSFAGGLVRQTQISPDGVLSFGGALESSLVALQSVAGALSFAGTLIKQAQISPDGALTFSGDTVRQTNKNVAGSLSFNGLVVRLINKNLDGTLTFGGALVSSVIFSKLVIGTLSFVGGLATLFVPGGGAGPAIRRMWRSVWSRVWKDPGKMDEDT